MEIQISTMSLSIKSITVWLSMLSNKSFSHVPVTNIFKFRHSTSMWFTASVRIQDQHGRLSPKQQPWPSPLSDSTDNSYKCQQVLKQQIHCLYYQLWKIRTWLSTLYPQWTKRIIWKSHTSQWTAVGANDAVPHRLIRTTCNQNIIRIWNITLFLNNFTEHSNNTVEQWIHIHWHCLCKHVQWTGVSVLRQKGWNIH